MHIDKKVGKASLVISRSVHTLTLHITTWFALIRRFNNKEF